MSLKQKDRAILQQFQKEVKRMILARKKASSRVMSEAEFVLQCPEEVRVPASRGREKSMSS